MAEALMRRDLGEVAMRGHFSGFGGSFGLEAFPDADSSRFRRFCNSRSTPICDDYALITAMSGWTPMMFMTRSDMG
jgi:hypothetical protein